jgi:hypothetical protein
MAIGRLDKQNKISHLNDIVSLDAVARVDE